MGWQGREGSVFLQFSLVMQSKRGKETWEALKGTELEVGDSFSKSGKKTSMSFLSCYAPTYAAQREEKDELIFKFILAGIISSNT